LIYSLSTLWRQHDCPALQLLTKWEQASLRFLIFFAPNQITPKHYIHTESRAKAYLKVEVCSHVAQVFNNSVEKINLQQVRNYSSYEGKVVFKQSNLCAISGLRREADENRALLGYYAASSGNFLPTFRDRCCPETSVRSCHYSLRNNPEERGPQK
jgi:hypothetical protein